MSEIWVPIVAIVGGLGFAAYGMYLKMKARQLMHQERLAMIERGLIPPPLDALSEDWPKRRHSSRHTGIIFMAIAVGMLLFFGFLTKDFGKGLGFFGLFFALGLGLFANAMLDRRQEASTPTADQKEPR